MNVPQTGTGSGYSTALLENLTGNEGTIVSLDIEKWQNGQRNV
ncbi:hypothetical protein [Thermoactinomyces mirandus]|uniref:Uncharacterized protein n=1 Tax=Thermoactinomyces mirandus TaxID=2756294 RepID=A0A7W2AQZ6_9BACL|nr:hypothetical protein [Thermoactinomyces mirandus]